VDDAVKKDPVVEEKLCDPPVEKFPLDPVPVPPVVELLCPEVLGVEPVVPVVPVSLEVEPPVVVKWAVDVAVLDSELYDMSPEGMDDEAKADDETDGSDPVFPVLPVLADPVDCTEDSEEDSMGDAVEDIMDWVEDWAADWEDSDEDSMDDDAVEDIMDWVEDW